MTEQKDTEIEASVEQGVSSPEHVEVSPSPAVDGVAAEAAVVEQKTEDYQPRYLGKKYEDIGGLEKAYDNALDLANKQGQEKNKLAEEVAALKQTMETYGLSQAQPQESEASTSPVDVEALIEQRIAPVKRQMAIREEQDAIEEVVRMNPELKSVSARIMQAWRLSGNEPLSAVVNDFKALVQAGRNISTQDTAEKKEQQIETGKGVGQVTVPSKDEQRTSALKSGSLDAIAASLPDEFGL